MSRRADVVAAVKALLSATLPQAKVLGLDGDEAVARAVPPGGLVVVRDGDPGEPSVDLSPPAWNWRHRIPIEAVIYNGGGLTSGQRLDAMLMAIDAAVALDPTLGGLADWSELGAPTIEDLSVEDGGRPPRGADLDLTVTYTTASPLG